MPRGPSIFAPSLPAAAATGGGLGYLGCVVVGWLPFALPALLMVLAIPALATLLATLSAERAGAGQPDPGQRSDHLAELDTLRQRASECEEAQRRFRHDLRGALSPVMLVTDRLITHADPAVQRTGTIMLRSVERATALLDETAAVSPHDRS